MTLEGLRARCDEILEELSEPEVDAAQRGFMEANFAAVDLSDGPAVDFSDGRRVDLEDLEGPMRDRPGALLEGDFDEDESAASFAVALADFRARAAVQEKLEPID